MTVQDQIEARTRTSRTPLTTGSACATSDQAQAHDFVAGQLQRGHGVFFHGAILSVRHDRQAARESVSRGRATTEVKVGKEVAVVDRFAAHQPLTCCLSSTAKPSPQRRYTSLIPWAAQPVKRNDQFPRHPRDAEIGAEQRQTQVEACEQASLAQHALLQLERGAAEAKEPGSTSSRSSSRAGAR